GPAACNGNCSADSDCANGTWCSAGVCVPLLAPGQACGGANQCGSQHCVDAVCCDTACTGQCEACAESGSVGTCTPVAGGPRNARTACASDGSLCAGTCDGIHPAACTYPGNGTTCRDPSCSSGIAVLAASCDGSGSCPPEQDVSCAPNTCGPTACAGNCTVERDRVRVSSGGDELPRRELRRGRRHAAGRLRRRRPLPAAADAGLQPLSVRSTGVPRQLHVRRGLRLGELLRSRHL